MKFFAFLAPLLVHFSRAPDETAQGETDISWVTRNWEISRGHPFTIEWTGHDGPVTVTIVQSTKTPHDEKWEGVWEVTSGNQETSLVFTSPDKLTYDTEYAFEIKDRAGRKALSPHWILNTRQISTGMGESPTSTDTDTSQPTASQGDESTRTNDSATATDDSNNGSSPSRIRTDPSSESTETGSLDSNSSPDSSSVRRRRGDLSNGARIGIGVGISVVVIAIAALIMFCRIRRAKKKNNDSVDGAQDSAAQAETKVGFPQGPQGPQEVQGSFVQPGQTPYIAPQYGYEHFPQNVPAQAPPHAHRYASGYALGYKPQASQEYELHGQGRVDRPSELDAATRMAELGPPEARISELPTKYSA